jgi:hypothetical protein
MTSGPWTADSSAVTADSDFFASGSEPPPPALPAWSADSSVVTADSGFYTADGGLISIAQFPNVPALPGVPALARLQTAAVVAAGATTSGETVAIAVHLGLPTSITLGTNALYAGLALSPLPAGSSPQLPPANPNIAPGALPPYGIFGSGTVTVDTITTTFADGGTATSPGGQVGSYASWVISPDSVLEFDVNADSNINTHPVEQGGFQAYNRVQEPISIRMLLACQGKNMTRATFLSTLESLREGTQIVTIASPDTTYPNMVLKGFGYKKTAERGAVTIWADTQWMEERSNNVVVTSPPTSQPQGNAVVNLGTLSPQTPTPQQQAAISNPPTVYASYLPPSYAGTQPPSGDAQ